ncbi:hypothetical protein [Lysinibacillus sp. BW-2-10]|uniref:hypothetical protein n=1 Tax=Lysinibacillus sp. BW-2-10 TaxID=2590030 RepID=UPI00117E6FF9|nr:hypothetical protein [Lysinibacillus sp. BW-2-10]TSI02540.1 hypothetical protein FJQ64_18265 [Lysinibacillus sp. BW-2-10]
MDYEQVLHCLNNTRIKINTKLMQIKLKEYEDTITSATEYILDKMASVGIKNIEHISEKSVVDYCNEYLVNTFTQNTPYHLNQNEQFNLIALKEHFPKESFVIAYLALREWLSLKKRYTSLLKHEKNGFIQPIFAVNSISSIYTAKPTLLLPHSDLALYLDCDCHHFNSLEEAMNVISNAKADSEIITVIKKTVYFRTPKYYEEKENKRQEAIKVMNRIDFMPLFNYYDEFDLEYLDLSYLLDNDVNA